MEPVEFRDMVYAVSVCEEKSFSRAAERCFITQPSLSKSVKKLENNIGFALFDRGSSPVEVTRDGQNVIGYFRQMPGSPLPVPERLDYLRPLLFLHLPPAPGGVRFPT